MFRFLHVSDLHLGKAFGSLPEEVRGRLVEARHEVISRIADAARARAIDHVLVAGDLFDTIGPSDAVRRQAAAAMNATGLQWWIIPGNHDSLAGEELWRRFDAESSPDVHVLREPAPVEIAPGVVLLPAPLPRQFPGIDLTAWMPGCATPEGALRIGLAHGGVTDFGEDFDASAMIPPDRDRSAGLDYLALGDWHGRRQIGPRVHYSGTPEQDRFRHGGRGLALAVTIPARETPPEVEEVETGRFHWSEPTLSLSPGQDVAAALAGLMPADRLARRDMLMRVRAEGWLRLPERGALSAAARDIAPDFHFFALDESRLRTEYGAEDLDLIAPSGALRQAAEILQDEALGNAGLSEDNQRVAEAALNRLWSLVREE
ncbi:DNA repair exonuclease SbcCD nuclease subunit [Albidovulum inexpectatum]|uniref:DNA repair exonuclease SbcCD nuclease subunit n=1 Tax=Albidovulum inexpectatum TaxID=196587 RepID=A0A2S5JHP4_9RHOB|nr:metallophosphoesterase [Albidovulum inexpectatum]PPB80939.1 DNA repair exonuclease SbcCD nuclease subunit [Albidovulum inexpectatum]